MLYEASFLDKSKSGNRGKSRQEQKKTDLDGSTAVCDGRSPLILLDDPPCNPSKNYPKHTNRVIQGFILFKKGIFKPN